MTSSRQPIRIISERSITSSPEPGVIERKIAITYQFPPRPPNVVFVLEGDLPDLVWRRDNPGQADVPEDIQRQGDEVRRRIIERAAQRRASDRPRVI